jgi:beta-galactosidase
MKLKLCIPIILFVFSIHFNIFAQRQVISLNGTWEIAKTDVGSMIPTTFSSKVSVPGLVDMAIPAVEPPFTGALDKDKNYPFANNYGNKSYMYNNSLYWYKRTFILKNIQSEVILLKINKAMFSTHIYLNNKLIGQNSYSFTPTYVNIKPYLNEAGKANELIISVGCRNNLPDTVCRADDGEKVLFCPGIYDDVNIIMSGFPYITNVQTAPDVLQKQLRVAVEIENDKKTNTQLSYIVRELKSNKVVAKGFAPQDVLAGEKMQKIDFKIALPKCKLWSPESPFLYTLELNTGADKTITRFGMRTFRSDKQNGVVLLNEKTYYMRGTNIAILRFFEDSQRGNLPWDDKWVTKMHKKFKSMHWNSFRNTLGFPPERWYEIADSLGFLIQDEYPLWKQVDPKTLTSDHLANEYTAWMRERWNHPSVVIWDAQNESKFDTTNVATNKVRSLDLSNRPWDNGYNRPAGENDIMESHPYLFGKYFNQYDLKKITTLADAYFEANDVKKDGAKSPDDYLSLMANPRILDNSWVNKSKDEDRKTVKFPIIINEYGWLWLNRDGSPTTLDKGIYANVFPEADTPEKRFEVYAKIMGMKTEFWRAHRLAAGVLHFCGLSYSRSTYPIGQTSDNWYDVKNLVMEPHFVQYMKPAFSPVGLMINFWKTNVVAGKEQEFTMMMVNDTYEKWSGKIKLTLEKDGKVIRKQTINAKIQALGNEKYSSTLKLPIEKGKYKLVARIVYNKESVKSTRDITIE